MQGLPTKKEIQFQRRAQAAREKQEYFERRFKARDLIFRKGKGKISNLRHAERQFVQSVEREGYRMYLMEFAGQVRPLYSVGPTWSRLARRRDRKVPMTFGQWLHRWRGSQKVRYFRHDLPMMMNAKFKNLVMQNG